MEPKQIATDEYQ